MHSAESRPNSEYEKHNGDASGEGHTARSIDVCHSVSGNNC